MTRASIGFGWFLIIVGGMITVFAGPSFYSNMVWALKETKIHGLDERLTNIQSEGAPWLKEQVGGQWGRYGWSLSPGEEGMLRIALPGEAPGKMKLRIWAFDPGQFSARLISNQNVSIIPSGFLDGQIFSVPVGGNSELVVRAANALSDPQLVLDRFSVAWFSHLDRLPSFLPFALSGVLVMVGWGWLVWFGINRCQWQLWLGCAFILVATGFGYHYRWVLLELVRALPVDPDVVAFMSHARGLVWFTQDHGFFSGSFGEREPMHVAALNLWMKFWGENFPAIRWLTVALSTSVIVATAAFVWGISKQWSLGAIAGWVMGLHPVLIDESVRGLRLEGFTLFFIIWLSVWLWGRNWVGAMVLGLLVGGIGLFQAPALSVILPVLWIGWLLNWWRSSQGLAPWSPHHWSGSHLLLASFLALALTIPHLYGLYKVHGDPSWPAVKYARWNANFEFPQRLGTAGFPSPEEFAANPYAGPRITYWDYLFKMHSVLTLVKGHIKGWIESTAYMSVSNSPNLKNLIVLFQANGITAVLPHLTVVTVLSFFLLAVLTALGWFQLVRHNLYWWVPFLSLWGTWYAAYLYSVRLIEPFRHTGHVYPLLLFTALWGGYQIFQLVNKLIIHPRV